MKMKFPECDFAPGGERLTEKHVQAIWYDREMRPARLDTIDGIPVRVVDPGEWNLVEGPDFLGAVLEIGEERRRVTGDVEIHLRPSDWTNHHHGDDPAYRNVVLHVTWYCGMVPSTLPKGAMSIAIGNEVAGETGFSPECIDLAAYPFSRITAKPPPCRELVGSSPERAHEVLRRAGERRLRAKAQRIAALLAERPNERMQILYEEIMGALGYRRNSKAFRSVARMIPLRVMTAEPENVEYALLTASEFIEWDRRGTRPGNSPEKRLRAAAAFFTARSLAPLLEINEFSKAEMRLVSAFLAKDSLMGAKRAAATIANVIVPFAMAEGRIENAPDWLPPEDFSSPMRLTALRMFGRDHNPFVFYLRNGLLMQGLLQIHREFCLELYPDCVFCTVSTLGVA